MFQGLFSNNSTVKAWSGTAFPSDNSTPATHREQFRGIKKDAEKLPRRNFDTILVESLLHLPLIVVKKILDFFKSPCSRGGYKEGHDGKGGALHARGRRWNTRSEQRSGQVSAGPSEHFHFESALKVSLLPRSRARYKQ